jgi:hypothetical protein
MTLPYGEPRCIGAKSIVNPSRPASVCLLCLRRTLPADHAWQKWLEPAPAKHDGAKWTCEMRAMR